MNFSRLLLIYVSYRMKISCTMFTVHGWHMSYQSQLCTEVANNWADSLPPILSGLILSKKNLPPQNLIFLSPRSVSNYLCICCSKMSCLTMRCFNVMMVEFLWWIPTTNMEHWAVWGLVGGGRGICLYNRRRFFFCLTRNFRLALHCFAFFSISLQCQARLFVLMRYLPSLAFGNNFVLLCISLFGIAMHC